MKQKCYGFTSQAGSLHKEKKENISGAPLAQNKVVEELFHNNKGYLLEQTFKACRISKIGANSAYLFLNDRLFLRNLKW